MNHYYAAVRRELKISRGKEVVTTGDGLLATFGAPATGVRCATAIREAVRTLGLEIRVGLHTGEYKVSGTEVFGLAFHIGARRRRESACRRSPGLERGQDLMSQSGIRFKDRGVHQLKGVPERWRLYRVRTLRCNAKVDTGFAVGSMSRPRRRGGRIELLAAIVSPVVAHF